MNGHGETVAIGWKGWCIVELRINFLLLLLVLPAAGCIFQRGLNI